MVDTGRVAEMMGVTRPQVYELVRRGQLKAVTFPGSGNSLIYRFRIGDVQRAMHRKGNGVRIRKMVPSAGWDFPEEATRRGRPRIAIDVARAETLRNSGLSYVEIARELGVSAPTVAKSLHRARPRPVFDADKAVSMRRGGARVSDIAIELGVTTDIVYKVLREQAPVLLRPPRFRSNDMIDRMIAMRRSGSTYKEIGAEFGMPGQTVGKAFKTMGISVLPTRLGAPRKQFDIARALDMRSEGKTYGEIGRELGLSSTTVARAIRENSGLKGSMFNFDIKRAVKMRREGYGFAAISKAVGVSRPTVTNAIKLKLLSSQIRRPRFDLARAIQMRREPKSYRAIAKALGVSIGTIAKHLHARVKEVDLSRGPRSEEKRAQRAAENSVWVESISTEPARPSRLTPDGAASMPPLIPSAQLGRPPKHTTPVASHRAEASRPHLSHHAHHAKNP